MTVLSVAEVTVGGEAKFIMMKRPLTICNEFTEEAARQQPQKLHDISEKNIRFKLQMGGQEDHLDAIGRALYLVIIS